MPNGRSKTGRLLLLVLTVAAAMVFSSWVPVATANPTVQQKREQLQRIKEEVERIDQQLELVVEQYNLTNIRISQLRSTIAAREREVERLRAKASERRKILGERIRMMYKAGTTDVIEVLTECGSVEDLVVNLDRARRIGGQDARVISQVLEAEREVSEAIRDLEAKKAELDAALADLEAKKSSIEAELQRRKQLVAGVEEEINRLIAEEEARRAAEAARRSAPSYIPSLRRRSAPPPPAPPYAPAVVKVAYAQLGKPYVYGAAGPGAFDCSGLVMYCYAQVGVSLPHSSYMQARCGVPVSYDELRPGDLVFFRGFGHVGIYIGGGQYIHAPHTGDVVKISSLAARGDFCGAVRVTR